MELPLLECILTPSRDLAYLEGAAPINPICVQLLHHPFLQAFPYWTRWFLQPATYSDTVHFAY
jgi:hypothetical protein